MRPLPPKLPVAIEAANALSRFSAPHPCRAAAKRVPGFVSGVEKKVKRTCKHLRFFHQLAGHNNGLALPASTHG